MDERVIPLWGIHNLRDYGGYSMRDGATLKRGLLWRSGQHVDATADDLEAISNLHLATIIDLRSDSERELFPCARHPRFAAEVRFASDNALGENQAAPHVEAARFVRTPEDAARAMTHLYSLMPWRPYLVEIYRLYFEALANREGASLLHCLAGKDRTGVAAAVLHHLMGVHPDDIMADYLLTNQAGNIDRRIAAGAKTVRSNFGPEMEESAVRVLMSVQEDFLIAAFDAMRERYGSVEAYARDVLGVDDAMVARIASQLAC